MWFRRDLRLEDNPAWAAATASDEVVALVVLEPALLASAGAFRRRAFLAGLAGLERSLVAAGGGLRVEVGDPAAAVPAVAREFGAHQVVVNADVTRWSVARDRGVEGALAVPLRSHWGTLVQPPGEVLTRSGTLSRVFTPFHRRWQEIPVADPAEPGPALVADPAGGATLSDALDLLGETPAPAAVDEEQAGDRLDRWLAQVDDYPTTRDRPDVPGTSALSADLRFGLLSPRHVARTVGEHTPGRAAFVRQLAWRDWYAHLTLEHPDIDRAALRSDYDRIVWRTGADADADFAAWAEGRTGYPIVDAGMRQLAATGWMHNRVRMITGSFLVKDLLIDWRRGERWFRRLLVDGDIPQNAGNWQWVAGTGPDAAPYFRIFNPVAQGRRHDPDGDYVRRWVPELAGLAAKAVHAPWELGPLELAAAGVVLGDTYPAPLVDHAEAREATLATYRSALDHLNDPDAEGRVAATGPGG